MCKFVLNLILFLDAINEDELDSFNEISAPNEESNEITQEKKPEDKHQEYLAKANKGLYFISQLNISSLNKNF